MIPKTGDVFRRFSVLEKVGEGGMGVVFRAHDTELGRDVALKFVTQADPDHAELNDRLRCEAASLGALNHPNIVTIHDIDEVDGVPFLVLEWIGGRALNAPSFSRPLPIEEFRRISLSVAEALGAAHDRGIVHRDVKPSNVLVSEEGRTKVVDFGLAKFRYLDSDMTQTAGAVGTVAYMSPEQASGAELGPASDIFSFGVLAYELLAAQRPFTGNGPGAVLSAIMGGQHVPLSRKRIELPGPLIAVVERCLESDPARRFQNGRELADALRRVEFGRDSLDVEATNAAGSSAPKDFPRQRDIRFCTTADGARLAYSLIGAGPPLARVLGHFTHLEMEWEWPDLRFFWECLAERHTVVRYDGRGIGLSDRYTGEFTEETRQFDLDAVLEAPPEHRMPSCLGSLREGGQQQPTPLLILIGSAN